MDLAIYNGSGRPENLREFSSYVYFSVFLFSPEQ